jgi:hypothetical protein
VTIKLVSLSQKMLMSQHISLSKYFPTGVVSTGSCFDRLLLFRSPEIGGAQLDL